MKKKLFAILVILSLTACAAPQTVAPTSTSKATITATVILPTLTATETAIDVMANIAQGYIDGTISKEQVLNLSFEEQKDFAILYCDKKNEQRGANPIIFTDRNGDKFYVDPVTLDFAPINDGSTAEQQTIKSCIPKATDKDGFSWVKDHEEWVRIEGSDKIQFNNFNNFPWPAGEPVDPQWVPKEHQSLLGLTVPEYVFRSEEVNMVPIFFLGKEHGQTDIAGSQLKGTVLAYVITENDPFSVTPAPITGIPALYTDNLKVGASGDITEGGALIEAIISGDLYYVMYQVDQTKDFAETYPASNGQEATINYSSGLAKTGEIHGIITGEIDSNNLPLINALLLVKAGE